MDLGIMSKKNGHKSQGEGLMYNVDRKTEGMEPEQKQYPVVDVTGDVSKVQCCKDQYCTGTQNVSP